MSEKNNNSKRFTTFLNIVNAMGNNDNHFHFAVSRAVLSRFEKRTVNAGTPEEKVIVTASMPVNGRNKLINKVFETNYGDDDTIWVNVTFWNTAERILNFLEKSGNPSKVQMIVTGSLSSNEFTRTDGSKGNNIRMQVNDFNVVSIVNNNSETSAVSSANTETPAQNTSSNNDDFGDDEDFVDIDGSEDDLPF